ncbi:hypothetical protein C1646_758518 [Rhizophagus diaphanus]|nr:hypothetical protein C1646_758518 [Rhizophagus diaphanus] [Rhizophagus sp. MUCL 43196]
MKKKDGADYSVNSIRASLAAVNPIKEVVDGKGRYLSKDGKGKADKLGLANHPEVTPFLDKYSSLRPHGADPDFYLQEVEEEFDKAKVPEILNGQDSYNEQVMGKENNNFKTAKEDNILFINIVYFVVY